MFQKIEEFYNFRESIEKRIEEIEIFYEKNFDEPFVLNFYKGKEKLKKLLINEPYYINILSKKLKEKNNNTPINKNDKRSYLMKNITNYNNINNLNNSENKNSTYYNKENLPIQSYINNTNNCKSNSYNNNDNVEKEDNSL